MPPSCESRSLRGRSPVPCSLDALVSFDQFVPEFVLRIRSWYEPAISSGMQMCRPEDMVSMMRWFPGDASAPRLPLPMHCTAWKDQHMLSAANRGMIKVTSVMLPFVGLQLYETCPHAASGLLPHLLTKDRASFANPMGAALNDTPKHA